MSNSDVTNLEVFSSLTGLAGTHSLSTCGKTYIKCCIIRSVGVLVSYHSHVLLMFPSTSVLCVCAAMTCVN